MERPDEQQALQILKKYDSKRYKEAVLKDKPDIQNDKQSIGVEVTQSLKESVLKALQLPENILQEKDIAAVIKERYKEQTVSIRLPLPNNNHKQVAISMANWHSLFDLVEAYKHKVKKLKQGHYQYYQENNLFIFVFGEDERIIQRLFSYVKQQKDLKTYDYVYVFSTPSLYEIDAKRYKLKKTEMKIEN